MKIVCPKCLVDTKVCGCTWTDIAIWEEAKRGKTVCQHDVPTDKFCSICHANNEVKELENE